MKPTLTIVLVRPNPERDADIYLQKAREAGSFQIVTDSLDLFDEIVSRHEAAGVALEIQVPTDIPVEKARNLRELGLDLRLAGRDTGAD